MAHAPPPILHGFVVPAGIIGVQRLEIRDAVPAQHVQFATIPVKRFASDRFGARVLHAFLLTATFFGIGTPPELARQMDPPGLEVLSCFKKKGPVALFLGVPSFPVSSLLLSLFQPYLDAISAQCAQESRQEQLCSLSIKVGHDRLLSARDRVFLACRWSALVRPPGIPAALAGPAVLPTSRSIAAQLGSKRTWDKTGATVASMKRFTLLRKSKRLRHASIRKSGGAALLFAAPVPSGLAALPPGAKVSAVNVGEVAAKLRDLGMPETTVETVLGGLQATCAHTIGARRWRSLFCAERRARPG